MLKVKLFEILTKIVQRKNNQKAKKIQSQVLVTALVWHSQSTTLLRRFIFLPTFQKHRLSQILFRCYITPPFITSCVTTAMSSSQCYFISFLPTTSASPFPFLSRWFVRTVFLTIMIAPPLIFTVALKLALVFPVLPSTTLSPTDTDNHTQNHTPTYICTNPVLTLSITPT